MAVWLGGYGQQAPVPPASLSHTRSHGRDSERCPAPHCGLVIAAYFAQESALFWQTCATQGGMHVVSFLRVHNTREEGMRSGGALGPAATRTWGPVCSGSRCAEG